MDLHQSLTVPLPTSTAVLNLPRITTTLRQTTTPLRLATITLLLSTITPRPDSLNLNIIKVEDIISKTRLTVTLEGLLLKTNSVVLLPSNNMAEGEDTLDNLITEEEEEEVTQVNSSNIIRIKEVSNNLELTRIKADFNKVEEEGDTEEGHLTTERTRDGVVGDEKSEFEFS